MTWVEIGKWAVQLLVGGGIAALVSLLLVGPQKKKMLADSGKTDAEAEGELAEAYDRRADAQIKLLDPYQRTQEYMQQRIDDLEENERRLRRYVEQLCEALRGAGIKVPEAPPVADTTPSTRPHRAQPGQPGHRRKRG